MKGYANSSQLEHFQEFVPSRKFKLIVFAPYMLGKT
jgi:hypothetical protein